MEILSTPNEARQFTRSLRAKGIRIGLVPTMGALHAGHLSLVNQSQQACDATIATIFVNPTQFAPSEDLSRYPRTLEQDYEMLEAAGIAAVFVPRVESMYPPGFSTYVDPPEIARTLEGNCRPEHFRGVTTVVMKLFQAVPADSAFFGKKDYQQWKVIEAMSRDLDVGVDVVACEIIRESDGLALSSRNRYLDPNERRRALRLSMALKELEQAISAGERDVATLQGGMRQVLVSGDGVSQIDYAVIVNANTLVPLSTLDRPAVALIAARVGQTRLIDNRELCFGSKLLGGR
ncbi:MAG: pantoate--beta-alanine ligase [Planctomycetaceae bacterium]|nr:pantoate--beta-alanine ligase [Planctomycetaceae bacterium]